MAYIFYNPNPQGKFVSDCVIRAITKLESSDWDTIYMEVCLRGSRLKDIPSSNSVWGAYLKEIGYKKYAIPSTCPDCYTIAEFAADHPYGSYAVCTGTHLVAAVDGNYYDAWDSGNEVPIFYWVKEK